MRKVKSVGKEKGFWTKNSEIAYEELINGINYYQVSQSVSLSNKQPFSLDYHF